MNLWNDAWIPNPSNGRIQGQNIDIRYSIVVDLIDNASFTWKEDMVREIFQEDQLERVLAISLVNSK